MFAVVPLPGTADVYNLEIHGQHVYDVTAAGVVVHNAGSAGDCGHFVEYELRGRRGAVIKRGDEVSGVDFPLRNGQRLSFPDQSWYGHTESKVVADLWQEGALGPGRYLGLRGILPPCSSCRNIMKWASEMFDMTVDYMDASGATWTWIRGIAH